VAWENFHVTLKFLGDTEAGRLSRISDALAESLAGVEPFDLEIVGAGAFPSAGRPRTVWVGVTSGKEQLVDVAERVEDSLENQGFSREDRPFSAHVTIGRLRDDRGARRLSPALRDTAVGHLGTVRVGSVALMRSDLRPQGPVYSVLAEIPLGGGRES
jgi:2'-5' RNA ligase